MNTKTFLYKTKVLVFALPVIFTELIGFFPLINSAYGQPLYFQSNFETGDLSEWTANGTGGVYYSPPVQVTTELSHSGKYSVRCYLVNPSVQNEAKLLRWRIDQKNAFYSAWYYFDKNYHVTSWGNIMQWKTDPPGTPGPTSIAPTWFLMAATGHNIRQLLLYHWPVGLGYLPHDPDHSQQTKPGNYMQLKPIQIPDSTWVHIEVYYKTDRVNGQIIVWQDGVKVFDVKNVNTQDSIQPSEFVMFGVGNYISTTESINQLLYIDDIMITDYQVSANMKNLQPSPPRDLKIIP